jgi:hypothetical protein
MWTCAALIATAPALRTALVMSGADSTVPYVLPFCRMDALVAGAFVALALRGEREGARLVAWARRLAPVALLAVFGIWYVEDLLDNGSWTEPITQIAGHTMLALFFGSLVALTATRRGWALRCRDSSCSTWWRRLQRSSSRGRRGISTRSKC